MLKWYNLSVNILHYSNNLYYFVRDGIGLGSPGCPGTCDPYIRASGALGWLVFPSTPGYKGFLEIRWQYKRVLEITFQSLILPIWEEKKEWLGTDCQAEDVAYCWFREKNKVCFINVQRIYQWILMWVRNSWRILWGTFPVVVVNSKLRSGSKVGVCVFFVLFL